MTRASHKSTILDVNMLIVTVVTEILHRHNFGQRKLQATTKKRAYNNEINKIEILFNVPAASTARFKKNEKRYYRNQDEIHR